MKKLVFFAAIAAMMGVSSCGTTVTSDVKEDKTVTTDSVSVDSVLVDSVAVDTTTNVD